MSWTSSAARTRLAAVALGSLLAAPACSKPAAPPPAATPSPTPDDGIPAGDGPVARVNGVDIPREPFVRELRQTLDRYALAKHEMRPGLRERLKNNIVQRLVDAELIRQQAAKMGVTVSEADLKKAWDEYKGRYGDEQKLKEFLDKAGTTAEDLERQHRENLLREKVFEAIGAQVKVAPEQVRAFYEEHKANYAEPEQVRASHILLMVKDGMAAEEKTKLRARAADLAKQAAKKGANFEELARQNSGDSTASRGGDLGWFPRDRMVKPFEDAAFALKEGQVSGVVETPFGFHIIKKTGYRAASTQTFEQLAERIERQVSARERNNAIREALEKWKAEAKIELLVKGDEAIIASDRASTPLGAVQQRLSPHGAKPLELAPAQRPVTQDTPVVPVPGSGGVVPAASPNAGH